MSLNIKDSDEEDEDYWKDGLIRERVAIVEVVDYDRIRNELLSLRIFDIEDDEEILNQFINPTRTQRIGRMLDKILRKGCDNYHKFMTVIGKNYPDLYEKITDKKSPYNPPPNIIPRTHPHMNEYVRELLNTIKILEIQKISFTDEISSMRRDLEDNKRETSSLKECLLEIKIKNERYQSIEQDMTALKTVVDKLRTENYTVCMRLLRANEDNAKLREENMKFRVENDKMSIQLKKLETAVNSERSMSIRLRRKIDSGPSDRDINSKQNEIDNLRLQLAQVKQGNMIGENHDMQIQILQQDKNEAIEMCEDATKKLNNLRDKYSSVESNRDQLLEENESLNLRLDDQQEECNMYKDRRDAVWQQLQEVEKERDQLMKERNEAQLTAQYHMEEKTKYRGQIRNLEEKHDDLLRRNRQKANRPDILKHQQRKQSQQMSPPYQPDDSTSGRGSDSEELTSTGSSSPFISPEVKPNAPIEWACRKFRVYITKFYPEYNTQSEFDGGAKPVMPKDNIFPEIPLAGNYGNNCGLYVKRKFHRKLVRRAGRHSDSQHHMTRSISQSDEYIKNYKQRSLTLQPEDMQSVSSSTSSHKQTAKRDGLTYSIEINSRLLCDNAKFIGGNSSGIFLHQVQENEEVEQCGLSPGMAILEVKTEKSGELKVTNWTLEHANNVFQSLEGNVTLTVQYKVDDFVRLKESIRNTRTSGDSFYIRANYSHKREDLSFDKGDILHVVNTQPGKQGCWRACKVDCYNGTDATRMGNIPNVKTSEFITSPRASVVNKRRPTEPCLPELPGLIFMTTKFYDPSPYSVLQPILSKEKFRPCLILPNALSKVLSMKLSTKAEPLAFDFPQPGIVRCSEKEAEQKIKEGDVVSYKNITSEVQEMVTLHDVETVKLKNTHCVLSINENVISIEDYLNKLYKRQIYPVVISLAAEKKKSVQMLLDGDREKALLSLPSIASTSAVLKKIVPDHVQLNLDKCSGVDEAIKQLLEKFSEETNKVIWLPNKEDIYL